MNITKRIIILTVVLAAGFFMACNTDPYIGSSGTSLGAVDADGDGNYNDGTAIDADGNGTADGVDTDGDGLIDLPWSDDYTISPADDGDTSGPDKTAPGEVLNLKATKITDGNGCEVTFTWDDPSDSDLEFIIITYESSTSGDVVDYKRKGDLTVTCAFQIPDTISTYTFQTQDKTGNLSTGITAELYVPTARDLDITYVDNNDNLNTLLKTTGYYILEEDIVLSNDGSSNWTPVANFNGVLFGNGHSISNVTITSKGSSSFFGFFSETKSGSVISNLVLKNINVTSTQGISGTLVGHVLAGSRINNCGASGSMSSPDDNNAGGLLGYVDHTSTSDSVIENCYADVNVTGLGSVGGFAGRIYNAKNCYAVGTVEDKASSGGSVGGFAGEVSGSVQNCYAAGAVTGASGNMNIYGFAGEINSTTDIKYCYYNTSAAGVAAGDAGGSSRSIDLTNKTLFNGFDFNSVWDMDTASVNPLNSGMPYLTNVKPE